MGLLGAGMNSRAREHDSTHTTGTSQTSLAISAESNVETSTVEELVFAELGLVLLLRGNKTVSRDEAHSCCSVESPRHKCIVCFYQSCDCLFGLDLLATRRSIHSEGVQRAVAFAVSSSGVVGKSSGSPDTSTGTSMEPSSISSGYLAWTL